MKAGGAEAPVTSQVPSGDTTSIHAAPKAALGPGNYQLTIEGLSWRGDPEPDSWVTIGIQR